MPIDPPRRTVLVIDASRGAGPALTSGVGVTTCDAHDPAQVQAVLARHDRLEALVTVAARPEELRAAREVVVAAAELLVPGSAVVQLGGPAVGAEALEETTRELLAVLPAGVRVNSVSLNDNHDPVAAQLVDFLASAAASSLNGRVLAVGAGVAAELPDDAVVVVGMGIAVPGASTPEQFWELLRSGEPVFGEPGDRLDLETIWSPDAAAEDKTYSRVSGFMTGFTPHPRLRQEITSGAFDSQEYTALWLRHSLLSATERVTVRPTDRQLFAVGLTPDGSHHLEHTLVSSGVRKLLTESGTQVPDGLRELYPLAAESPDDVLPYRIARMAVPDLPESGEIVVVDTACSSSLYTIDLGVRALRAGEADIALCGGAFALTAQNLVLFSKLRGLSRSGRVRSLDRGADGVLFSDGAAVLALKTHARAIADGDEVLGFVAGFGGSSDGRGKAIYAPNAAGQQIALERAWRSAGATAEELDWVVAHATGTPTGDRTELSALARSGGPDKTWTMTSNKSLVGHSGWAAGAVSVVHALLAMKHELIPGQRQFDALPDGVGASVRVPERDLPWPAKRDGRRTAGVSAMGFGGTNGHLVLTDRHPGRQPVPAADDPVVVVATGAHLPGAPDRARLERWLSGGPADWPAGFGDAYPLPSPAEARLAPSAIAAMDRSQLMALRCADLVAGDWVGDERLTARSGVFVGHTGPTRNALGFGLRYHLDDLATKLDGPAPEVLGDSVRAMTPPINEDAYPGLMPNVIAARVVQRLDLHGPNMTLDAGRDSVNSALATAIRYLRDGELDLAVVMGVNANTEHVRTRAGSPAAEAAIGFVLTRESIARERGMTVLGQVALAPSAGRSGRRPEPRDYRGADGAVALLRALHGAQPAVLQPVEDTHSPAIAVTPRPAETDSLSGHLARHALVLRPVTAREVRPRTQAIPPGSLVLTDAPQLLAEVELPADCLVVVPRTAAPAPGVPLVRVDRAEELARVLAADGRGFGQVRVLVGGQSGARAGVPEHLLDLHDLAFAAAKHCAAGLNAGGGYAVLALDAADGLVPLPYTGLFGGLVRSLSQELTGCLMFALVTDRTDLAGGLGLLAEESAAERFIPVAYHLADERLELMLVPVPAQPDQPAASLPEEPVIVATGGARGLTAHLVHELVAGRTPRGVWLLGSGPAPDLSAPGQPLKPRPGALRELLARYPSETPVALSRRYDRAVQQAERLRVIRELEQLCGAGRVHYRQCDVLDEGAVRKVIDEVHAVEGRVDVLVHGAGLGRSAGVDRKRFDDFRAVRDVKVRGYANLRAALGDRPPALWCSVSSVSAFIGLRGEPDYGAANEFLLLAAAHTRAVEGADEAALASGLWTESGMASADTPAGAFLARQNEIGRLTDTQGREFFRMELRARGSHGLATTWIGDPDWATLERRAPGFRTACQAAEAEPATAPAARRAFLTTSPELDGRTAVWTIEVGLDEHPYLRDHLVDGRPTVPGTFILELAAEAATALAPGLLPARITDVVLSQFIRAAEHRWPRTLRIAAVRDGHRVRVRVTTPASGPVPEREHTRMVVQLARTLPAGPWCPPVPDGGTDAPNTYGLPGTTVELSGVFGALQRPRLVPDGGAAELRLDVPADGVFAGFVLPSTALDCLLRTSVLDGRQPGDVPVMVPTALASVDLYSTANDLALAAGWPDGLLLRHWFDPESGEERCALVGPDGRALAQVTGISGAVRGSCDPLAGTWR